LRRRLLPHPYLTVVITVVWVLLVNEVSVGAIVFGLLLGIAVPLFTSPFWPERQLIRNPRMVVEYILVVLWDIVMANLEVAYLILFRKGSSLKPVFMTIPLDVRTPAAITIFAGTITMTPGTVSADLSADGRALLVHALNNDDVEDAVASMKQRYEARLKEIFE
jgi:multicomponent K+:H+ antiporter subunit E